MLPNPLHPAIVHFPVVLAFLVPIFAIGALWMIRRGARERRAWALPLAMAGALLLSAWVSVETGQAQGERVERVVPEQVIETHEEAAETFMIATAVVLLVMAAGLLPGVSGKTARVLGTLGTVGLLGGAAWVGHTGGKLVYQHGAASAYVSTQSRGGTVARPGGDSDDR